MTVITGLKYNFHPIAMTVSHRRFQKVKNDLLVD